MREDFVELVGEVQLLAGVAVASGSDQHLGLDLTETINDPLGAEIRRATRPGGAEAGGGEHTDHGLPGVGHECSHPITDAHARVLQGALQSGDMGSQLRMAELFATAILADGHQCWMTVTAT